MKRTTVLIIIVALISAAVTFMLMRSLTPSAPVAAEHAGEAQAAEQEAGVKIADLKIEPAVAGQSWDQVSVTGKVGAKINKTVKVGPRIGGRIVRVYADAGDVVRPGQTLTTMSSVELAQARAAYRQAAARVSAAKESYERQVKLAGLGAFSKRPAEESRSEYSSAQGDLAQARSDFAQSKSELVRAESELTLCRAKLERAKELYKDQIISKQDLEASEAEFKRDIAEVEAVKAGIHNAESKVERAESQVSNAKTYMNREEKVLGTNLLASKEVQSAKAELKAAELDLRAAADTIRVLGASPGGSGDTVAITSPIAGRIVSRSISLGEMADPSDTLFVVMDLSDVWVEADVYEKDLSRIHKGQTAEIRVGSYTNKTFIGTVIHIGDVLDAGSRTAKVRCAVSNTDRLLKPEMFATVNIITSRRGGAVLIPTAAVLDDGGKKIVFQPCVECEEDVKAGTNACGAYDKREVALGAAHKDKVEILKGVNLGESVVTTGAFQLKTALGSGKLEAGCSH